MYKYYYRNRPGGFECQPDGWADRQSDCPMKTYQNDRTLPFIGNSVNCFGWVVYEKRLTIDQQYRYELLTADPAEYTLFLLWQENKSDRPDSSQTWNIVKSEMTYYMGSDDPYWGKYENEFRTFIERYFGKIMEIIDEQI